MDLDNLAKLGEFVGGFFVILSLVYLAYQVRQNTKSLHAENYARLTADFDAFGTELMRNDRLDASAVERWRRFVAGEDMSMPATSESVA